MFTLLHRKSKIFSIATVDIFPDCACKIFLLLVTCLKISRAICKKSFGDCAGSRKIVEIDIHWGKMSGQKRVSDNSRPRSGKSGWESLLGRSPRHDISDSDPDSDVEIYEYIPPSPRSQVKRKKPKKEGQTQQTTAFDIYDTECNETKSKTGTQIKKIYHRPAVILFEQTKDRAYEFLNEHPILYDKRADGYADNDKKEKCWAEFASYVGKTPKQMKQWYWTQRTAYGKLTKIDENKPGT